MSTTKGNAMLPLESHDLKPDRDKVNPTVKVLLSRAGTSRLVFCQETSEPGDHCRHYASAAPARTMVVFHNGLEPQSLTGAVVAAQRSEEIGLAGYVRASNVGRLHSKITIDQRVNGPPDITLAQMLDEGQQDET